MKNGVPLIINQITSFILFLAFLIVTLLYTYLKRKAPSNKAKRIYKYLAIAWTFFTLTYLSTFLRNFFPREGWDAIHIWAFKIEVAVSGVGVIWLFKFISELYNVKKWEHLFTLLGWGIGGSSFLLYLFWGATTSPPSGFSTEHYEAGVEIIPPFLLTIVLLSAILAIIISFLVTAVYFNLKLVRPEMQRKITLVSIAYIIFWIMQILEGMPILAETWGNLGMILTRGLLASMALISVITWVGKQNFVNTIRKLLLSQK